MLVRLIILTVITLWLVASLPQSRFLWVSTTHPVGSFDWWAGVIRAVIIDFLPLMIVFVQSELEKRHKNKAKKSFDRRNDKDTLEFEVWQETYPTVEKSVAKRLPMLFILVTFVIAVSYEAYYQEFGVELAIYKVWGGMRFVVHGIFLTIAALVTYTFGRLGSAVEVGNLPDDFIRLFKEIGNSLRKIVKSAQPNISKNPVPKSDSKPVKIKKQKLSPNERRRKLLDLLHNDITQRTIELASTFSVTDQTIRNDFRVLATEGKIIYVGGKPTLPEWKGDF